MRELDLENWADYRTLLEARVEEWQTLDRMCRITISRFYRDRAVFDLLASTVLPELAGRARSRDGTTIKVWSAGCGSGEEPYTVALLWESVLSADFTDCGIRILGTDDQPDLLRRASEALYSPSALRDLPEELVSAFERREEGFRLAPQHRAAVHFVAHDLRTEPPLGPFDLVLCRNLAFTYWDDILQIEVARKLERSLRPGGFLVIGVHEMLPLGARGLTSLAESKCVFLKS
jgi:chemotaxis protein methyltransferase CheR